LCIGLIRTLDLVNFDKFRPRYHNGNKKITRSDRNYGHAAPNEQLEIGTRLR